MGKHSFDAVIFDLDGVITKTALVHAEAWKVMFDEFLRGWAKKGGKPFLEFTYTNDYLPYIDGKPRYSGVESFLKSRNIEIPYGTPDDSADTETVCGLGNKKNKLFNELLITKGVEVYQSTVDLLNNLKAQGIKLGVASSSKNCKQILERVNLLNLFDTRVDGLVSAEMGLNGKPEPDIFTVAADNLGAEYARTVIVEDAESGVQAGKKGNFGLIIGIARDGNAFKLKEFGADIVVEDLQEIQGIKGIDKWFDQGLNNDFWSLTVCGYNKQNERSCEGMFAIGNGYFATRGALEECIPSESHYPGTYIAGLTNGIELSVAGKKNNVDCRVNIPNWIEITFKVAEGDWFNPEIDEVLELERNLNFRNGILHKRMIVRDRDGRETLIESRRFASLANPHHAAIDYSLTPLNYSDHIRVKSGLEVPAKNDGIQRNKQLNKQQLVAKKQGAKDNISFILTETLTEKVQVAVAAKLDVFFQDSPLATNYRIKDEKGWVNTYVKAFVKEGESIRVEKMVSICSSTTDGVTDTLNHAINDVKTLKSFGSMHAASQEVWKNIWDKIDVQITGDRLAQKLVRYHLYHTLISISPISNNSGVPSRGLIGEVICNHTQFNQQQIEQLLSIIMPEMARNVLHHHFKNIEKARKFATTHGFKGAAYPFDWQSNCVCESDSSVFQANLSLGLAYNILNYYKVTGDKDFIANFGAELYLDICRYWASRAQLNSKTAKFDIIEKVCVNGNIEEVENPFAVNLMAIWILAKAFDLVKELKLNDKNDIFKRIGLTDAELFDWVELVKKINISITEEGIIRHKSNNGNLKDGLADDVLAALSLIGLNDAETIITNIIGKNLSSEFFDKNFYFYLNRSSKSTPQQRISQANVAAQLGKMELSWNLFLDALKSDYEQTIDYNTSEGVHLEVLAGTVLSAIHNFAGLKFTNHSIAIKPNLPKPWKRISFCCKHNAIDYRIEIEQAKVTITSSSDKAKITVNEQEYAVIANQKLEIAMG